MAKVCPHCGGGRYRLTARNYRGKDLRSADLYICVDCTNSFPEPVEKVEAEDVEEPEDAEEDEQAEDDK
jgi:hypothetical protein